MSGAIILIIIGFGVLCGYLIGAALEQDSHQRFCLCERCKKWRQRNRDDGKEPE